MCEVGVDLIVELVAGPSASGPGGVTGLGHEVFEDAVEDDAVVVAVAGEEDEVVDGPGHLVLVQVYHQPALGGLDDGGVVEPLFEYEFRLLEGPHGLLHQERHQFVTLRNRHVGLLAGLGPLAVRDRHLRPGRRRPPGAVGPRFWAS